MFTLFSFFFVDERTTVCGAYGESLKFCDRVLLRILSRNFAIDYPIVHTSLTILLK